MEDAKDLSPEIGESREERIKTFETISKNRLELVEKLADLLDELRAQDEAYNQLLAYYHSHMWQEDVEADEAGLIDPNLPRGILSEDGIYNLIMDHHVLAIQMLDMATDILR